jgi:hypothetical protein
MPRFPRSEPDIAALALVVTQGLGQASEDFPTPPVPADELQGRLDAYNAALSAAISAETAAREQHAAKDDALEQLVDGVKANLKYAEIAVRDHPERLSQLGWGVPNRGSALEAPGEVRDIAVRAEGDTWVVLDWKAPVDGGAIANYKIERRNGDGGGSWELADTAVETEHLLSSQPRGVGLEYRVIGVNRAGSGKPSATVTVVL